MRRQRLASSLLVTTLALPAVLRAAAPASPRAADPVSPDETAVLWVERQAMQVERNAERARERFSPCSTFKIPNALIAIDGGALDPERSTMAWDPQRNPRQDYWPAEWARDQDLTSALRYSVVWYFQAVARRTGPERMQSELERLRYGNADLSGGIDRFWLGSSLRISAEEQVRFLRALLEGKAGFSEKAKRAVLEPLTVERGEGWRWWGKTGACRQDGTRWIGWLVGGVERPDGWAAYAVNVEGKAYAAIAERRFTATRAFLESNGLLGPVASPH